MELPGTSLEKQNVDSIKMYLQLVVSQGGVSLNQICAITGLDTYMIQNWVKRGYVPHPVNKKYNNRHLSRILLINSLKECMKLDDVGELMHLINGKTDDESDDIIKEDELYLLFCDMVEKTENTQQVEQVVDTQVSNPKLNLALKVMINAYKASQFTIRANNQLKLLKEE